MIVNKYFCASNFVLSYQIVDKKTTMRNDPWKILNHDIKQCWVKGTLKVSKENVEKKDGTVAVTGIQKLI